MAFKGVDAPLNDLLMQATEKEVLDDINKLIDKKVFLALSKIIATQTDVSGILSDPDIQAESARLKNVVAEVITAHESAITAIARSKVEAPEMKPSDASHAAANPQ